MFAGEVSLAVSRTAFSLIARGLEVCLSITWEDTEEKITFYLIHSLLNRKNPFSMRIWCTCVSLDDCPDEFFPFCAVYGKYFSRLLNEALLTLQGQFGISNASRGRNGRKREDGANPSRTRRRNRG